MTIDEQVDTARLAYSLEAIAARVKLALVAHDRAAIFEELRNLDAVSELFKKKVKPN